MFHTNFVRALSLCLLLGCGGSSSGLVRNVDAFGVERLAFVIYLDPGHYSAVGAVRLPNERYIEFMTVSQGSVDTVVPAGTPVRFRVGSEIVTLATRADAQPVVSASRYQGVFTQWILQVDVPAEATVFGNARLSAIGLDVAGREHQLPVSESKGNEFMTHMRAILGSD